MNRDFGPDASPGGHRRVRHTRERRLTLAFVLALAGGLQNASGSDVTATATDGVASSSPERRIDSASLVVTSSLYEAGRAVGLSSRIMLRLTDIFAPVAELSRELNPGDRVSVVYERILRNGEPIADGAVLAAELSAGGRTTRLFRHSEGKRVEYYRENGVPVLGAGLVQPVSPATLSSGFTNTRRYPVLGSVRAHNGLDFGARLGAPVVATADGRIAFKGRQRGYGNTIILDHGAGHATLYAHLSRFSSAVRENTAVGKGDIIGFVGQSGLTSGSNLHYEVRVDGAPVDPRKHRHPTGGAIADSSLREFRNRIRPLVELLDDLSRTATGRAA